MDDLRITIRNTIASGYLAVCAAFVRKDERAAAHARRFSYFYGLIDISLGTMQPPAGRRSTAVELAAQVRAALDAGDDAGALRLAGAAWTEAAEEWTDLRHGKGSK